MTLPRRKIAAVLMIFALAGSGCSRTTYNRDFNGLTTPQGRPVAHLHSMRAGFHLLMGRVPFLGNANLSRTLFDFTKNARKIGGTQIDITTSEQTNWWFSFLPFTLLLTPTTSTISGNVFNEGTAEV